MAASNDLTILHDGQTYKIALRRNPRATRFTLRVRAASGEVVLTAPTRSRLSEACRFAAEHAEWIHAKLIQIPESIPFQHGSVIPIRGIDHEIIHLRNQRGLVTIEHADDTSALGRLFVSGHQEHLERRTCDFLKGLAKNDIEAAVRKHCETLNVKQPSATIRDTVSRWGSCSSTGALNFSWRLIFAPAFILDYLAAHEVAHLREMNHSIRFWTIVESLCPETRSAEKWLDEHGSSLHRYGSSRRKSVRILNAVEG